MATKLLILLCKNCLRSCLLGYFLAHSRHNFTPLFIIVYTYCTYFVPTLYSFPQPTLQSRPHLSSESTMLLRKAVED